MGAQGLPWSPLLSDETLDKIPGPHTLPYASSPHLKRLDATTHSRRTSTIRPSSSMPSAAEAAGMGAAFLLPSALVIGTDGCGSVAAAVRHAGPSSPSLCLRDF